MGLPKLDYCAVCNEALRIVRIHTITPNSYPTSHSDGWILEDFSIEWGHADISDHESVHVKRRPDKQDSITPQYLEWVVYEKRNPLDLLVSMGFCASKSVAFRLYKQNTTITVSLQDEFGALRNYNMDNKPIWIPIGTPFTMRVGKQVKEVMVGNPISFRIEDADNLGG